MLRCNRCPTLTAELLRNCQAHKRARDLEFHSIYGNSKFEMIRAKTRMMHQSDFFSMIIAFFIVAGFLIDIAEAQVIRG